MLRVYIHDYRKNETFLQRLKMTQTQKYNKSTKSPVVWVISEGLTGTENQCLGVAESLGVQAEVKRIKLSQPWAALSPWLGFECGATFCPQMAPPWPDLLIASGRKSIAASKYIKKMSGGRTFTVQIQDPRISPKHFDLVAVPQHDPTRGENVIVTTATPNRITAEKLEQAKNEFAPLFSTLPSPRIAVLVGGSTKNHKLQEQDLEKLVDTLATLSGQASLMVTTSRRTGEYGTRLIQEKLGKPDCYIWDGLSPNPYWGMLAWADYILATNDSTSMLSESASTGKPVYNIPLVPLSGRQLQLVENLKTHGAVRDWHGTPEDWSYPALNDAAYVAAQIRQKSGLF